MRITCPNCGAQYNIPRAAIPAGGREVQCSSCRQTWFQKDEPDIPKAVSRVVTSDIDETSTLTRKRERPVSKIVTTPKLPPRPKLDDEVATILQEEAAVSAPTSSGFDDPTPTSTKPKHETPPIADLEKPATDVDPIRTRERISEITSVVATAATAPAAPPKAAPEPAAAPKQSAFAEDPDDLFQSYETNHREIPSLDEINETLKDRRMARDYDDLTDDEIEDVQHRRGFRRGFFLVLFLLALPLVPYVFEERLTALLPQSADMISGYNAMIDSLRERIAGLLG